MTAKHLWQGEWVTDAELEAKLPQLAHSFDFSRTLTTEILLTAAESLAAKLQQGQFTELVDDLLADGYSKEEAQGTLAEIGSLLQRTALVRKLQRELGSADPFLIRRPIYAEPIYEAWAPLGVLVHIAPGNAPAMSFLSALEGLLTGNINIIKTSSKEGLFSRKLLKVLSDQDPSGTLKKFIYMFAFSSSRTDLLSQLFAEADGIAVWGGEDAVNGVKKLAPPDAKVIAWGHKLSFAYITSAMLDDDATLEGLAFDACNLEQQACSSPQCVFVEAHTQEELYTFARKLTQVFDKVSPTLPAKQPSSHEAAEITTVTELAKLGEVMDESAVLEAADKSWRLLVSHTPGLRPSPLYRTLWVAPMERQQIPSVLRPFRSYLQTAGLACSLSELAELTQLFTRCGVARITRPGQMLASYSGEPHDGMYALSQYCRRISVQQKIVGDIASFAELAVPSAPVSIQGNPLLQKEDLQKLRAAQPDVGICVRSGGSSGKPVYFGYSYANYHHQMQVGADGLFAAGLDPASDRCMNLFYGNYMYGGQLSFSTVLEKLGALQFPMGAVPEYDLVAKAIVEHKINTLLGMPSYLMQLFQNQHDLLKQYGGVKKLFYGGEHLTPKQADYLRSEFDIDFIRSGAYGSNDTGPMGYTCPYCANGVHHLAAGAQYLEILTMDNDYPVDGDQPGRLVFTPLFVEGQRIGRYEIGDLGRWVSGDCPCGRKSPRFELLGRYGDVFKAGTDFFNYRTFIKILAEHLDYAGAVQLLIDQHNHQDRITVCVEDTYKPNIEAVRQVLLDNYHQLYHDIYNEHILSLTIQTLPLSQFVHTETSGKLRLVVDHRIQLGGR